MNDERKGFIVRRSHFIVLLIACACASASAPASRESNRDRGFAALRLIDQTFKLADGLYADHPKTGDRHHGPASIWPAGIQLSAMNAAGAIDPARIVAARRFADALLAYRTNAHDLRAFAPVPRGGERYFDDNEWLILDYLETYDLTHDRKYLDIAKQTMRFILSGESNDLGGGVWWRERRDTKNTCSNAPAICDALRLYQYTHDANDLAFARRVYAWTNAHLQAADGLYFDHLEHDGSLNKTKWSYNTALMIRANCLFYDLAHEEVYLTEARRLASAAQRHWFDKSGAIRDEASFAHLLCESLLTLAKIDHDRRPIEHVRGALDFLQSHRDAAGFYPPRWNASAASNEHLSLIDQASAARGFLFMAGYEKQ